ncbi:A disintegrin and metalloproteinase with thrombospondin motifs 6-like [Clavelina lepadiformis]|uniref:A disintegrin and metalloproteinase with thrombospondin motifs 6-like n=1 Tax=Clavelina lepadiformis TaxID=159417 RepID=UPI00404123CD
MLNVKLIVTTLCLLLLVCDSIVESRKKKGNKPPCSTRKSFGSASYKFFGVRTLYKYARKKLPTTSNRSPENCHPVHIYLIARHGARLPHKGTRREQLRLQTFLRTLNSTGNAKLCSADMEALRNWVPWVGENVDKNQTEYGDNEIRGIAKRFLALGNIKGVNYFNGNYTIDWPCKLKIAGTTFSYKRPTKEPESLQSLGPTSEDLVITVLLQEPNRGIRYEYNVPIERHGSGDTESAFLWDHGDWTPCTASCAGGTQKRPVICRRVDDDTVVSHSYCAVETMPVEQEQSCNAEPCPPTWSTGYWSECSRTCGGGHRTRNVMCMRKISQTEDEVVHRRYCTDKRPSASESCNTDVCPPQWDAGQWSSCKPRCGPGHKTRDVTCMSSDRRINYDDDVCDALQRPSTRMRCNNGPCPTARWMVSQWSQCSAQCGRGQKRRRVACMTSDKRPSNDCVSHKPRSVLACETPCARPPSSEPCEDDPKVDYCRLVLKYKFCHRAHFRKMCCGTCTGKKA